MVWRVVRKRDVEGGEKVGVEGGVEDGEKVVKMRGVEGGET